MNRQTLEHPFDPSLIKTRKGAFGQTLSYVEGAEYIRRLNDAFEGQWSFAIIQHHIRDTEVVVLGQLVAGNVSKVAFGGSSITVARDSGEIVSVADDLKSAATDALKKACSLLGVGLHLYCEQAVNGQRVQAPRPNPRTGNGNGNAAGNGRRNDRLTQRQLSAIWSMARSLGQTAEQIRQRSIDVFGVVPEQLAKSDASVLIQELGEGLSGGVS